MILDWPEVKTGTGMQFPTITVANFKMGYAIQKTATSEGVATSLTNTELKEVTLNFIRDNKSLFEELSKL